MIARFFILICALLLFAGAAFGQGAYQKTKDGKTTLWNDHPRSGDVATWSGARDREGYATGFGTLTWYVEKPGRSIIYARYFGNMTRGKLNGPVNAHSKGKTAHAFFDDGNRTTRWAVGPAPSHGPSSIREEPGHEGHSSAAITADVSAPRSSPTPASPRKSQEPARKVAAAEAVLPVAEPSPKPSPSKTAEAGIKPKHGVDDSLRALVGPPSSLREGSVSDTSATGEKTESSPSAEENPPLTRDEVIDLANTIARAHGFNPSDYEAPEVQRNSDEDTWSLTYGQKPDDGATETGKHFTVSVDGRTKKATITPPQ